MAQRKKPEAFTEALEEVETTDSDVIVDEPTVVLQAGSDHVNARIKGTWTMFWGTQKWDFVDGARFKIPTDLYDYLRRSGNIYDTL
jgi:hypothetical protein